MHQKNKQEKITTQKNGIKQKIITKYQVRYNKKQKNKWKTRRRETNKAPKSE